LSLDDFNFTLSEGESWGSNGHPDPLASFLKDTFTAGGLVDILPEVLVPTWRNGQQGADGISKRLDRHFVSTDLLEKVAHYRAWVALPFVSDHAPIVLQLDCVHQRKSYPFKLNPSWIREAEFTRIVSDIWQDPKFLQETGCQRRLVWKLQCLKLEIKKWSRNHKKLLTQKLDTLEEDLQNLYQASLVDLQNVDLTDQISKKEVAEIQLLKEEEESWRQKSRAVWLQSGDRNTKYFHHYASAQKNCKQIWELHSEEGMKLSGPKELKEEAVNYFKHLGNFSRND
jgi:hypothetical protein